MDTHTYRAENMLAAIDLVKKELGSDAIIISVRQVLAAPAWQVWQKPMVEVLAMRAKNGLQGHSSASVAPLQQANPIPKSHDVSHSGTQEKAGKKTPSSTIPRPKVVIEQNRKFDQPRIAAREFSDENLQFDVAESHENDLIDHVKRHSEYLVRQGFDRTLVKRIGQNCLDILSELPLTSEQRVREFFKAQLIANIRFNKQKNRLPRIICLTGLSGSGKTATCAKLAIRLSNGLEKKVTWVCADTIKISAISEAKVYAETVGVPLKLAYTPEELSSIVKVSELDSDYVVIDTPSINPSSEKSIAEITPLLTCVPQMSVWLVASTSNSGAVLASLATHLSTHKPSGLVITKIDECNEIGGVYNLAWKSQIPVVFVSAGSRILDDLMPADGDTFFTSILSERLI